MTPERWQQIDKLFHAALACEPAKRAEFLRAECGDDEPLRLEVESLISSHQESASFTDAPVGGLAAELLAFEHPTLAIGEEIRNYRIVRQIGAGGMGEVYLANDTRLGRQVALKILPPKFTADPQRVNRFEQEARAASALNHPNIITIHEIGRINNSQFIVTEFVDGQTLRRRLQGEQITLAEALEIAIQVAAALEAAHAAGIVHRDIKPENIMLRADGYVKVLDFGLAKLTEVRSGPVDREAETRRRVKTDPGMVMGTVQYMSPEQARGRDTDTRTDLWSLGVVLYELINGSVPFDGETPSHVVVSILERDPRELVGDDLPAELKRIVNKTLNKKREERYQTARDLALDLKSLKGELEVEARLRRSDPVKREHDESAAAKTLARETAPKVAPPGTQPLHAMSSAEYIVTGVSRHKGAFAAVALVLVIAMVTGGYFYFARRPSVRSIAVLPFSNSGNNPDLEYLSDGLSESLTNYLAPVPGLTVIARYSSFRYKGKETDPQEVGKSLGVDAIVTGRVSKVGDNYLISVELINAADRSQIWGKQYDRKSSDLLLVQSEISREITDELRLRLSKTEEQQLAKTQAVNPQAYDLYLKALALWNNGKSADQKKAIEYYQQATAVDPAYALAYADLSGAYSLLITNNELPQKEFAPKAEAAAETALMLDPNLAEAHLAVGKIKMNKWEWPAAETEIKRALELNPNLIGAHRAYATFLMTHGRLDEAVVEINRAQQLDPLKMSMAVARVTVLAIYRQDDQALEGAKQILQVNPNLPGAHIDVGQFYARLGRNAEAIDSYLEAIRLGDESGDAQILLGWAYAKAGQRDKAREILTRFETGKLQGSPVGLAMIHLALGDVERTFAMLEEAYAMHDQQLIWLRGAWEFDTIRSDSRFEDLVRRVGL